MPARELSRPISEVKAELFRALGHPARIRVLELLADGERSVGDIAAAVGLESSNLSQQLAVLRHAGLVTTRKQGPSVIYRIRDRALVSLLATAKKLLINSLSESQELLDELRPVTTRR
jgi:DNA-binding transcriptional ArsR family regulator